MTIAHLLKEISRVTKFHLEPGARVFAILTSTNYCISPLVHGSSEIPCQIEIHMAPTVRNKELIRIYESCVDTLYYERQQANIVGSFESKEVSDRAQVESRKRKTSKNKTRKNEKQQGTKDIRSFLPEIVLQKHLVINKGK